jgi:uncharacterized membrane protein YheB (UPF0754 family)
MHWAHLILTVFLFAFTGWLTTWLLTRLLFRPRKPINILGIKAQGIIPKNQLQIAKKMGELVSREFSFSQLQDKVADPRNLEKLKPEIEKHIDHFLREKLKVSFPMLGMFIGDKTINQLKGAFLMELETLFPILMKNYIGNLEKDIDLQRTVTDKIAGFSMDKLEEMLGKSAKGSFMYLQLLSAFVGLVIGLVYVFITILLYR